MSSTQQLPHSPKGLRLFQRKRRPRTNLNFNVNLTLPALKYFTGYWLLLCNWNEVWLSQHCRHAPWRIVFKLERSFLSLKAKETKCKSYCCQEQPCTLNLWIPGAALQVQRELSTEQERTSLSYAYYYPASIQGFKKMQ